MIISVLVITICICLTYWAAKLHIAESHFGVITEMRGSIPKISVISLFKDPDIMRMFCIVSLICLLISLCLQVYIGSWGWMGTRSVFVVWYVISNGGGLATIPLLPSSFIGAYMYISSPRTTSAQIQRIACWLLATCLLESSLVTLGYGVVHSSSELNSFVGSTYSISGFIFFGLVTAICILPAFGVALGLSYLIESAIFRFVVSQEAPKKADERH